MPLGTVGHLDEQGRQLYKPEAPTPCPRCKYRYDIEVRKVSATHTIFVCPQCSATWESHLPRAKPKPPPKPGNPKPPAYRGPADVRAALAGEPAGAVVAEGEE